MRWEPRTPPEGINVTATHPLAEFATLVAGVAAVTVVVVALAAWGAEALVARLPAGLENALFGRLWDPGPGTDSDPRARPAGDLLRRLADHWAENPYDLRLRVMEASEPNAFALPGGMVIVTSGLLDEVASENELAFVLGHELGHFRHRDHLRGLGRQLVVGLVLAAAAGSGGGEALPALASAVTESGFARAQEREADAFGLGLLQAEYGHVEGADHFFRRLETRHPEGPGDRVGAYLATHPLTRERVAALRDRVSREGFADRGPLHPFPGDAGP